MIRHTMIHRLGVQVLVFLEYLGHLTIYTIRILRRLFSGKWKLHTLLEQMVNLGIQSLPITIVTSTFVGMAFAIQVVKEFLRFGAAQMIGGVVGLAIWRELGPLLTGVVIAGRVGSAIAAELGSMKVTEQVEALETMSQDPISYLAVPRVLALTFLMPFLVAIADITGFLGGFLVAVGSGKINPVAYFYSAQVMLTTGDILGGLLKAVFFGFVVSIIGSYMGLTATAGAKGVGRMTRISVVASLISIFVLNYFLSLVVY